MPDSMVRNTFEILTLVAGIAFVSMLVLNAQGTSMIIKTGAESYGDLLAKAAGRGLA